MARLTTSKSITTQQVLDNTRFLSSQNLRSVQTKLTAAKGELIKLANTDVLSEFLSEQEKAVLRSAAGIVNSVNARVTAAKEKKQRAEKKRQADLDARIKAASRLAQHTFTLPTGSTAECLEVIRVALILNELKVLNSFNSAEEFSIELIARVRRAPSQGKTIGETLQHEAKRLANDIPRCIQDYIVHDYNDCEVQAVLDALVARIAEARPRVIEQRAAVLHVWLDALESCGREVRA